MTGSSTSFKVLFPQGQIPIIVSAIFLAGQELRKKNDNEIENQMTSRLYNAIVKIPIFRDGPLDIGLQPAIVSSTTDDGAITGQIDLRVSCGLGYEVYFAIEAKRLRVPSATHGVTPLSSKYVDEGMMRFITGQYAPFMESGAMLGYVFDGNLKSARNGIDKAIQKKAIALKLKPSIQLQPSNILPGKPIDETYHDLTNRPFTIYHILLAV